MNGGWFDPFRRLWGWWSSGTKVPPPVVIAFVINLTDTNTGAFELSGLQPGLIELTDTTSATFSLTDD